jgi:hypothetical protein
VSDVSATCFAAFLAVFNSTHRIGTSSFPCHTYPASFIACCRFLQPQSRPAIAVTRSFVMPMSRKALALSCRLSQSFIRIRMCRPSSRIRQVRCRCTSVSQLGARQTFWCTGVQKRNCQLSFVTLQAASLNVAPPLTVPVDKFLEVLLKVAPPLMVPPLSEVS